MDKSFRENEEAILRSRLIPPVRSLKLTSEKFFTIVAGCKFEIACPDEGASTLAA